MPQRAEKVPRQLQFPINQPPSTAKVHCPARDDLPASELLPSLSLHVLANPHHRTINHNSYHNPIMRGSGTPERGSPGKDWQHMAFSNGSSRNGRGQTSLNLEFNREATPAEYADWQTYTFLDIFAQNLPENVTTIEIWKNLNDFGNINKIEIKFTRKGTRARRAVIRFKPPPKTAFWETYKYHKSRAYERLASRRNPGDNSPFRWTDVRLKLSNKQPIQFSVQSPVRPDVRYDAECTILADSIDFGVLLDSNKMMIMETKTTGLSGSVKMVLNLFEGREEINVFFPHIIVSENNRNGLSREYRFSIPLDQKFSIFRTEESNRTISFILDLKSPPPFKKKLDTDHAGSHSKDSTLWFEDDLWSRQTDIVRHKNDFATIDKKPITVRKDLNCISIGRWNTFRVTISQQQENMEACRIFQEALQDYNIAVQQVNNLDLLRPNTPPDPPLWSVLNEIDTSHSHQSLANAHWLSQTLSGVQLPFAVRYQLEVCVSHGWLSEYNIDLTFLQKLSSMPEHRAKHFLICVASRSERFFNPMDIFDDIDFRRPFKKPLIPESCVEMYHASVTATNILYHTPSVEMTNRVVRQYKEYADRFLRVHFEDDEYRGNSKIYAADNNRMILIFRRVERAMRHGIKFGGRLYQFLAWGNSQLREHGAYFFASGPSMPTAASMRAIMGEFDHEKIVAKRAARIGQCFSTTKPIHLRLPRITQENLIPDIFNVVERDGKRTKYTFTDGVGKISKMAATIAANQLKIPGPVPSVFQFRLGGCKGILALSPDLKGNEIKIRESQFKFKSNSGELEIIRSSEFWHSYLNRQLILVLSELGIPDEVFLSKQQQEIDGLGRAMRNDTDAIIALRDRVDPNRMTLILADLVADGFRSRSEPFVTSILGLWRAWCLKYLKEKAKLPLPEGAFVLGSVDETAILRGQFDSRRPLRTAFDSEEDYKEELYKSLPEVFLQITDPQTGKCRVIKKTCIVARNPSLHPGDIRVVKAIDVPALHHLRDVLIMPQNGDRDLPSMCSGGDLDGDDYIVIWDEKLIPDRWDVEPFHYDAPPPLMAEGEITQEHFIKFFHEYMKNDFLGRIAHAHLGWADFMNGIQNDQCMELVRLHSMAVDYPKTGIAAMMSRELTPPVWPHFMEKKGKSRHSDNILGQLYDKVDVANFIPSYRGTFDNRILNAYTPSAAMMQSAQNLKHEYDRAMQRIMAQHKIGTEFEIWTTFVLDHSKAAPDYKFHEEIGQLSKALKDQYYESIVEIVGGRNHDILAPFAVAAYKITQGQLAAALRAADQNERTLDPADMPFITFPWVLHEVLGNIATKADHEHGESSRFDTDGNLVAGTAPPEFDSSGNAIVEATASHTVWEGRLLEGSHYDRRFGDPYSSTLTAETEPASMETESPVHVFQDSSVMHSEVDSLSSTIAGSSIESNDAISPQYNTQGLINAKSSMIDSSGLPNSSNAACSTGNAIGWNDPTTPLHSTQPFFTTNLALPIRTMTPVTQDLPQSPTGYVDADGVYHSPYRRQSGQSGSSSAGRRDSTHLSAPSFSSKMAVSPTANINGAQSSSILVRTCQSSHPSQVFADPASGSRSMARFAPPDEDDWS